MHFKLFLSLFAVTLLFSILTHNKILAQEEDEVQIKFNPKIIDQYVDEEGNMISVTEELPESFQTDENGNLNHQNSLYNKDLNKDGKVSTQDACSPRYTFTRLSKTKVKSNGFISWHPHFSDYNRVNNYYFTAYSRNFSVGLSGYGVSVSASVAGAGSGYSIPANYSRWSRPAIYGDAYRIVNRVNKVNPCGANSNYNQTVYTTANTYIKALYR